MSREEVIGQEVSTPIVVVFAAFLASFSYIIGNIIPTWVSIRPENNFYEVFVGITSILFAIGFTIFVQKKMGIKLSFGKIFVVGWLTTLLMSLFISAFYVLAFKMQWIPLHEGEKATQIIPIVILKYNALGLVFSSLLALIFKNNE